MDEACHENSGKEAKTMRMEQVATSGSSKKPFRHPGGIESGAQENGGTRISILGSLGRGGRENQRDTIHLKPQEERWDYSLSLDTHH